MTKALCTVIIAAALLAPTTAYAAQDALDRDLQTVCAGEAIEYSEADVELLARLIYAEARGEDRNGKLVVAQCAIDRLKTGEWGHTLRKVIYAEGQFAALGRTNEECLEVARAALEGERYSEDVVLYFRVTKRRTDWYAPYIQHVGDHALYGYAREVQP